MLIAAHTGRLLRCTSRVKLLYNSGERPVQLPSRFKFHDVYFCEHRVSYRELLRYARIDI